MLIDRIIASYHLRNYRRITESNLARTQKFIKENAISTIKSFRLTFESAQFLNINSYDLWVLSYNYLLANNKWDKILFARMMSVNVLDFFDRIFTMIGRDLLGEIKFIVEDSKIDEVKSITRDVSSIRKKYESKLRSIRNLTIAHKTEIASDLYHEIMQIDHREIYLCTTELLKITTQLNRQLTDILRTQTKLLK